MKTKILRYKNDSNKDRDKAKIFENLLFGTCIVCFLVLIIIQILLVIPAARESLNLEDKSMGVPLSKDEFLYKQGQITLKMIGSEPDPTIEILVNGDYVAMFEDLIIDINVKDGDVIEIDGSRSLMGHIISVEAASANISRKCTTAVARVESNIQKLVKVQIDSD